GIEVDNLDKIDRRVFFDLAQCEPVATAEDEYAFRLALVGRERRMDECLVIAVFIERIELQISIQKKRVACFPFCNHYALIGRASGEDDVVHEKRIFGERSEFVGFNKCDGEKNDYYRSFEAQKGNIAL